MSLALSWATMSELLGFLNVFSSRLLDIESYLCAWSRYKTVQSQLAAEEGPPEKLPSELETILQVIWPFIP